MSALLLDVRELSVAFGDNLVVDRASFTLGRGRTLALLANPGRASR